MKKFVILISIFFTVISADAQFSPGNNSMPRANFSPAIGHIYGKFLDSVKKPVANASVIILETRLDTADNKKKDFLLKGTTTESNGDFSLNELPTSSPLKIKISAIGYKTFENAITFTPGNFDKDLGNIQTSTDATTLAGVTVTSTKALMTLDIDKKVFNVEKSLVSTGGTALDVMKNVPSVNVDIDGNVSLRNSSPQIFIDGRPTTLTLEQIPADAIESVEVITNPSAKYDASGGGAGILNIVLKKNRKTGFNGNARLGVDKRGGINAGLDLNSRQGKINLSASGMINQMRGRSTGTTERLNLLEDPTTFTTQNNYSKTLGAFMFGKVGLDYFITNRTTFSISGVKVHGEFNPYERIDIRTDSLFNANKISDYSTRVTTATREFNGQGLVAGMKYLFPNEGENITADVNYFGGKNQGNSLYTTNYLQGYKGLITGTDFQKVLSEGSNRFITLQTDYTKPLSSKSKLEAGLRASLRHTENINDNYIFDTTSKQYNIISGATSNFKNDDNVYAAYATFASSINDFGYKVGLRAESSDYSGELLNTGTVFTNKYPVSLFPSVFLTQKLGNRQDLQLSYSRRINRPNFFQLIPIVDYTDKLNITQGNPALKPEFTQSLEMSYLKTFKGNNTFLASVYYRYTNNLITRYLNKELNPFTGTEDLINTYINANSSYSGGAEFTGQNTINKWWDVSSNVNIYNSKINTSNTGLASQDALWSWFGKLNSNFKLPAKFTVQLTGIYQSKTNIPVNTGGGFGGGGGPFGQAQSSSQGYISSFWAADVAVKKTFLKNDAASITLSVSDIFRTRSSNQHSESIYFIQDYNRIRDPQMFRLNFNYRFGKMDMSLFKRKNTNVENTSGATEGMR